MQCVCPAQGHRAVVDSPRREREGRGTSMLSAVLSLGSGSSEEEDAWSSWLLRLVSTVILWCTGRGMRAAAAGVTRDMGKTGTTDCTVVPWTGTRMRYAGLESRPGVGLQEDIKVGGQVACSSPHMCVPNGQRYQVTWVHVHALQDDKTRRNALAAHMTATGASTASQPLTRANGQEDVVV